MSSLLFKYPFVRKSRVSVVFNEPTRTHQSFQSECDVNGILARWQKTGVIEHRNVHQGRYDNFLSAVDYQSSVNAVIAANEAFASLPSSVRAKFSNNPVDFLQFVDNPANKDEMIAMGLMNAPRNIDSNLNNSPQENIPITSP